MADDERAVVDDERAVDERCPCGARRAVISVHGLGGTRYRIWTRCDTCGVTSPREV